MTKYVNVLIFDGDEIVTGGIYIEKMGGILEEAGKELSEDELKRLMSSPLPSYTFRIVENYGYKVKLRSDFGEDAIWYPDDGSIMLK